MTQGQCMGTHRKVQHAGLARGGFQVDDFDLLAAQQLVVMRFFRLGALDGLPRCVDGLLQSLCGDEFRCLTRLDRHRFARRRIAASALGTTRNRERTKSSKLHGLSTYQGTRQILQR